MRLAEIKSDGVSVLTLLLWDDEVEIAIREARQFMGRSETEVYGCLFVTLGSDSSTDG